MRTENNIVSFDGVQFDQWTGLLTFDQSDDILNNDMYIGALINSNDMEA